MLCSIDYLSWTIPTDAIGNTRNHLLGPMTEQVVNEFMGSDIDALLDDQPFTLLRGRAPYQASWGRADGGVRFYSSSSLSNVLVEVSGVGCKTIQARQVLPRILAMVQTRLSRIDLAVDIETKTAPYVFAAKRDVAKHRTITDWRSDSGDTFYVGSMKSDRYCRVYRFNPPHPRSAMLRVEHVFRRAAAKSFGAALLASDYAAAAAAAGRIYGWSHPDWQTENVTELQLSSGQVRKTERNTVNWLYGPVTQSIVKNVRNNQLDLEHFIDHLRMSVQTSIASATI